MTTTAQEFAALFRRELEQLRQEVAAFPSDELLWQVRPGLANPAGNLVLHLEGNLRAYIGRQLGGIAYERQRPLEFTTRDLSRDDLLARVAELQSMVPQVLQALDDARLGEQYPEIVLDQPMTVRQFLIHLHGHFMFHLAQVNDLRCLSKAQK